MAERIPEYLKAGDGEGMNITQCNGSLLPGGGSGDGEKRKEEELELGDDEPVKSIPLAFSEAGLSQAPPTFVALLSKSPLQDPSLGPLCQLLGCLRILPLTAISHPMCSQGQR